MALESNEDKETLTMEMFLIQELLTLHTEYDVYQLDPTFYIEAMGDILSNYAEMKSFTFPVLDKIFNILHMANEQGDFLNWILQLKVLYFSFIQQHVEQLGRLTVTGQFQANDYHLIKKQHDDHIIAFLKDFKYSYYSIWYIDPPGSTDGPTSEFMEA